MKSTIYIFIQKTGLFFKSEVVELPYVPFASHCMFSLNGCVDWNSLQTDLSDAIKQAMS